MTDLAAQKTEAILSYFTERTNSSMEIFEEILVSLWEAPASIEILRALSTSALPSMSKAAMASESGTESPRALNFES